MEELYKTPRQERADYAAALKRQQDTIDRQQSCIRHRDEQHNTLVAIGLDKDATITELKNDLAQYKKSALTRRVFKLYERITELERAPLKEMKT